MKTRLLSLTLVLCLLLAAPVSALSSDDFAQGKLSGVYADGSALLVTDVYNKVVWRVADGKVTKYAGAISAADVSGEPVAVYHDAAADKAYFMEPWAIAPFLDGYAVTDSAAHVVRYIADGKVATLAGSGSAGSDNGTGKNVSFNRPTGLAAASDGTLYVADTGNGSVRRIDQDGAVTTVATGLAEPTGMCWYDGALYVAETGRSRIVRVVNDSVDAFAGVSVAAEDEGEYYGGFVDGPAAAAMFDHPQGVAAGTDGTIYVADTGNSAVRAIRGGRVYTLARGGADKLMPSSPRGLLAGTDTLTVADAFAGSLLEVSVAPKTYADVPSDAWFAAAVESATRNGIADGTSDAAFEPNAPMNRAMFVTMLSRLHRLTDGTVILDGDATFSDVPEDAWYAAAVRWAADNKITTGEDGLFVPLRSISREELAAMLYRYAAAEGRSVRVTSDAFDAFADAADTSAWAEDAMRWACAKGVLHGDDAGLLTPRAPATRAQALTMLLNFMNAYDI